MTSPACVQGLGVPPTSGRLTSGRLVYQMPCLLVLFPEKLANDMYQRKVDVGGLTTHRMYSKI